MRQWWLAQPLHVAYTAAKSATSFAMGVPIAWEGNCDDSAGLEKSGNRVGRLLDAVPHAVGPRSWHDRPPKVRQLDVHGDRAGTYSGRWGREIHRREMDTEQAVRKIIYRGQSFTYWGTSAAGTPYGSTGTRYRDCHDPGLQYVTCEALQWAVTIPAVRAFAMEIRLVVQSKGRKGRNRRRAGKIVGAHGWFHKLFTEARADRRMPYGGLILTPEQRASLQDAQRKKRAETDTSKGVSDGPSYQGSSRVLTSPYLNKGRPLDRGRPLLGVINHLGKHRATDPPD